MPPSANPSGPASLTITRRPVRGTTMPPVRCLTALACLVLLPAAAAAQAPKDSATYRRLKAHLDSVPAIDTHDHLWPFDKLPGYVETERGRGMNLASLWRNSYYTWVHPLTPWKPGMK